MLEKTKEVALEQSPSRVVHVLGLPGTEGERPLCPAASLVPHSIARNGVNIPVYRLLYCFPHPGDSNSEGQGGALRLHSPHTQNNVANCSFSVNV